VYAQCRPLVIGDARRLEQANEIVGGKAKVRRIKEASEARYEPGTIDCIDLELIPADLPFGQLSPAAGNAAFQFIARAVEMAQAGEIDAIFDDMIDYASFAESSLGTEWAARTDAEKAEFSDLLKQLEASGRPDLT